MAQQLLQFQNRHGAAIFRCSLAGSFFERMHALISVSRRFEDGGLAFPHGINTTSAVPLDWYGSQCFGRRRRRYSNRALSAEQSLHLHIWTATPQQPAVNTDSWAAGAD